MSAAPVYSVDDEAAQIARALHGIKTADGWMACCPAHDDHTPSLSIKRGDDGKTLLRCFAGCPQKSVIDALKAQGLWGSRPALNGVSPVVTYYVYRDEWGKDLHRTAKRPDKKTGKKKIWQEHWKNGQWVQKQSPRLVLYHLNELLARRNESVLAVEGEGDADRLHACGYLTTTNVFGAGKWRKDYSETLAGRDIVLFYDNDPPGINFPGQDHAETVALSLLDAGCSVRIVDLPQGKDVSDYLDLGHTKADLEKLIAAALPLDKEGVIEWRARFKAPITTTDAEGAKPQAGVVRPRIRVSNRQLHEVAEESRLALQQWNSPPRLFSMGSRKVHLNESQGDTQDVVTVDLNEHSIRDYMSRSADYVKVTKEGDEVNVFPLPDLARNLLHKQNEELGLPPLEGVVSAPVVLRDGRILDRRGYDAGSGLYYLPPARLKLEALPEFCDGQAARTAREFIELELLSNFPFADESSKTHALAALLTPLVRHSMRLAPMFAIDATASSSGKGLLSKLICLVATGQTAHTRGLEGDEAEIRKSISSALMGNQAGMIVFDNVTGTIRSSALDRALTTEIWLDRELGHSRDLCAKQKACWFLTGNNVTIAGDLMRRICRIRLNPKMSRAYLRNPDLFRHKDIETWTLENRNQILIALLTMIRAWWQADCPRPTVRPLGSFEEWTRMVGGILEFSGATDFLANFTTNATDMDSEDMDWAYWLRELERAYPNGFTVPLLLQSLEAYENQSNRIRTLVPAAVAAYLDTKKGSAAAGLGMVLKYRKERRYLYADPDNPAEQTDYWLEPMGEKRPVVWTVKQNDVSGKH